jgi:tetratricopeptide (TPR) repeat protein
MAYNKTKFIEAAQKHLNQGRVSQAIVEYQNILRHEPKDQVTLMTIGDLYVRQGETFQALEYFERLAQLFLNDGFVTKAIAIYKKIAKLAPEEIKPLERLAELYAQQGVMSEARPLYLHLAEVHLKANRHKQAVALLRTLLQAEPDNLRVQTRLAELYHAMGQDQEAVEAHLRGAQRLIEREDTAEAQKFIESALKLDPTHSGALALKARALAAKGNGAEAVKLLESLPHLEAGSEAAALLIDQYLETGASERAAALALKVFEHTNKYDLAYKVGSALVAAGEFDRALELLGPIRKPMVDAGDHDRLAQALTAAADRLLGRLEPLEWLVDLYGQASDSFRLPHAMSRLAEAAVAAGHLEQAKQVYEQLLDRDRADEATRRRLNQVRARIGLEPVEELPGLRVQNAKSAMEEATVEAKPVPAGPPMDEETHRFVNQALTDIDLFSSYGLAQKATELLQTVLQRAPRHPVALEKLLDLSLGAGNDKRTAQIAAQLEQIYRERGDAKNAERFSELHRRFERAAGVAAEEPAPAPLPPEFAVPMVEAAPVAPAESTAVAEVEEVTSSEPAVHGVDLSEEWAALAQQVAQAMQAPPQASAATAEADTAEAVEVAERTPEYELKLQPAAPPPAAMSSESFFSELATEFDDVVAASAATNPATSAPVSEPVDARAEGHAGPLSEVFEEFRAELGEMGAEEEDLETHYNLGIAYREMGLLEEAIGEFQEVAKAIDKGRSFRYAMQCCTLLGLAFMEKGQPGIAAIWYERALHTPGLDQESILALRYDLGVAQQQAGEEAAALESFSQVYATNIDYRDVAERIAALGKRH